VDSRLNITVTADDGDPKKLKAALKDLAAEIKVAENAFKFQGAAASDTQAKLAVVSEKIKALGADEKALANITATLGHAQNRVANDFKSMATEIKGIGTKVSSSSDQLRTFYREQRVGDKTMRESTQAIGGLTSMIGSSNSGVTQAIGAMAARFQEAEFAITGLGIAAKNAVGKISGIGTTLMANAGPIAAAVAAIAGLVYMFNQAAEAAERFRQAQKALTQAQIDSGKFTKEQQIGMLTDEINRLRSTPISGPGVLARLGGAYAIQQDQLTKVFEREAEIEKKEGQIKKLREGINADTEKSQKSEQEEQKKLDEEYLKTLQYQHMASLEAQAAAESAQAQAKAVRDMTSVFGISSGPNTPMKIPKKLERGGGMQIEGLVPLGEKARMEVDLTFGEMMQQSKAFENAFSAGIGTVSGQISSQVGGAFSSVFGGANTLLGGFLGSMLSALTQIGIKAAATFAIGSLFPSMIPFLASGGPVVVGERGPELFVPNRGGEIVSNAKMARFGGAMAAASGPIVMDVRIKGNDLVLVQKKAGLARKGRVM